MRCVIIIDNLGIDEVSFDEMWAVERHGVRRIDMPALLKVGYVEYIRFEASELRSDAPDVQRWYHASHIPPYQKLRRHRGRRELSPSALFVTCPCGLYLLSASLTIPLVYCHINRFRRAARCGEAMARRRKEDQWAGPALRGM